MAYNILISNWMDISNPMAGGAEVHLMEIVSRLIKDGHRVTLVVSHFNGAKKEEIKDNVRIIRTGNRQNFNFVAPFVIKNIIKNEFFDIFIEDINKIPLASPLFIKNKMLVFAHHFFGTSVFKETNPLFASYVYFMENILLNFYKNTHFEVVSESTKNDLLKKGFPSDKIHVIYNGVAHHIYTFDENIRKFTQPTLLYVGRIKKYKSIEIIFYAINKIKKIIPEIRFVIVGSGDYVPILKKKVNELKLENNVKFTGFVSTEEKVEWMRKSHVIINPSLKEGWGLTNLEANACGTPSISSDVEGLRDSVKDGYNGYLFPYGDYNKLGDLILEIFKNKDNYKKLVKNSIEWAGKFTWDNTYKQTLELIEKIINT